MKLKKKIFKYYNKKLNNLFLKIPNFDKKNKSNNYIYACYINKKYKTKFLNFMKKNKVECKSYYNILLSENYFLKSIIKNSLPNSLQAKNSLICLPSNQKLNNNDLRKITDLIKKFFVNFSY